MSDDLVTSDSISGLSRGDWDTLTENDVYGQYGWLLSVEQTVRDARRARYFLLYCSGEPAAAAVLYEYRASDQPGRLGDLLFGRAASIINKLHLAPSRIAYCGPIIGQGRHVFWNKGVGPDEAARRVRLMLDHLDDHYSRAGIPVVFGRIPADEPELLAQLRCAGCIESLSWPINYIDIAWNTFDDYLKSLSRIGKNMSTKARREVAAPGKLGIKIDTGRRISESSAEIFELFARTNRKYGGEPPSFERSFIEALEMNCPNTVITNTAETSDEQGLVGAALLLRAGNRAAGPLIGVDQSDLNRKAFTYFNLSLYAPVKFCIEHRLSRMYLGSGMAPMKRKRGCEKMKVFVFVLPPGSLSGVLWRTWMMLHRYWVTKKVASESA